MRFYNLIAPAPVFIGSGTLGAGVHDRLDEALRASALDFLASSPAVVAPRRGLDMLDSMVRHTADESQPFYRVLLITDPAGAPEAAVAFGLVAGNSDAYELFALAARDARRASIACQSWRAWLEAAKARIVRAEIDSVNAEIVALLEENRFRAVASIADFYAPGEHQVLLSWYGRPSS